MTTTDCRAEDGAVIVVDTSALMAVVQMEASWRRWGKGGHPAGLNFGDCFAYALAKVSGEPLLFKGSDFSHTDIPPFLNAGSAASR